MFPVSFLFPVKTNMFDQVTVSLNITLNIYFLDFNFEHEVFKGVFGDVSGQK